MAQLYITKRIKQSKIFQNSLYCHRTVKTKISMDALIALIIFAFFPSFFVLVRNIFHATYIWQIKEYRVDRIISHLRFKEEESIRDHSLNLLQYGLFITSLVFFVQPANVFLVVPALTFASYWIEVFNVMQSAAAKKLIYPKKSIRNLLIVTFSFFVLVLPILIPINFVRNIYQDKIGEESQETAGIEPVTVEDFLIQENVDDNGNKTIPLVFAVLIGSSLLMIAADFASPAIVSLFAIATEPLAQIKRKRMISAAKGKIKKHKGFKVIAITGSYGKTTTKEILFELIKDNFKTVRTRENFNSPVGVAQEVIRGLSPETEVFIAEMGAYKKGEIAASTKILEPDISIVTSIGPQHISLFGSLENIVRAKYEIIENLKKGGLAIFNANNEYCVRMAADVDTDKRKTMYYVIDEQIGNPENSNASGPSGGNMLFAVNIKEVKDGFKFDLKLKNKSYPTYFKIAGIHNISNLLAAVAAALELGMDLASIAAKIPHIEISGLHLSWKTGLNSTRVLDDSYNSNIAGFNSALDILDKQKSKGKNILITRGIIELGKEKQEVYKNLAEKIAKTIDLMITSDKQLIENVELHPGKTEIAYAKLPDDYYNKIIKIVKEDDIILLEGRLSPALIEPIIISK